MDRLTPSQVKALELIDTNNGKITACPSSYRGRDFHTPSVCIDNVWYNIPTQTLNALVKKGYLKKEKRNVWVLTKQDNRHARE